MNTSTELMKTRAWTLAPELGVFDPLGRQILAERVSNAVGIAELPTDGLPTGLYSVVLLADGMNVGSAKFEIIR